MAVIKLKSVGKKIDILKRRRELKENEVRIDDDLTWKKRKMKWSMEGIAGREREKEKRVWVKYGRMLIEGKWWRWDKEEENLKDEKGRIWREQGEEQGMVQEMQE